ncbi:hypothetical protein H3146_05990 [Streptomyces sp. OF3]|uniref:Uncharacterized protein n=1 Tax=Streptomyces alkaliterrae TaxID=2213162 RepID=A0A7W3WIC8_9ACTN|nr:hypothetical protein [Streptomyces alkaliterrae]MBB1252918.1 hypothetical protein [Streptomyces alkaliterrae]
MSLTKQTPDRGHVGFDWRGRSGETVTGEDAAHHLEATLALLDKHGWTRATVTGEDAVDHLAGADETWKVKRLLLGLVRTVSDLIKDEDGPLTLGLALRRVAVDGGDDDTETVADRCITTILRLRTGARHPSLTAWAGRRGRTQSEIRDLLTEAAAFARKYGPARV